MLYLCLHSTERRMRYSPGKIVIHGCKLHVEAQLLFDL